MPRWLRILRMRPQLSVAALLAAIAQGAQPAGALDKPDNWLKTFCALKANKQVCAELNALKENIPTLGDEDFVHLKSYIAQRHLADLDPSGAAAVLDAAALIQAHTKTQEARPPASSSADRVKLEGVLEAIRLESAKESKLTPEVLFNIVDALYRSKQFKDANIILDLVTSESERAKVALRRGVLLLKQEPPDRARARAAFQDALKASPNASPPTYADEATLALFNEVKDEATRPANNNTSANQTGGPTGTVTQIGPPVASPPPAWSLPWNGQQVGVGAGIAGIALLVGGTGTGVVAYTTRISEEQAALSGDQAKYESLRRAASMQSILADVLSSVGGIALAAGTALYLFTPPASNSNPLLARTGTHSGNTALVGVGLQKGQVSLTIGGHF